MDANQVRQIVESEVRKALAAAESNAYDTPLLAIFCGARVGLSRAAQQIASLASSGFSVTAILSETAEPLITRDLLRAEAGVARIMTARDQVNAAQLIQGAAGLIVPVLTRCVLAKVAVGITDALTSGLILQGLMAGKPVVAARNAVDADDSESSGGDGALPPALRRLWAGHIEAARSYGMQFVDVSELSTAIRAALGRRPIAAANGDRTVITRADVAEAAGAGELRIPAGAIVTPLARDVAAELGVRLIDMP